jgi:hypothetical protein
MPTAQVLLEPKNATQPEIECWPSSEDYPMTFQIGLVGQDGILIGSDRMLYYASPGPANLPQQNLAMQRSQSSKFIRNDDDSIVCTFAGGPYSKHMAQAIASQQGVKAVSQFQWEINLQNLMNDYQRPPQAAIDEVIVVRPDVPSAFWVARKTNHPFAIISRMEQWACTGDNSPARFFPWHLYAEKTIAELRPLAMLTLAYASRENPSLVGGGFDLLTIKNGVITEEQFDTQQVLDGELCAEFDRRFKGLFQEVSKLPVA